MARNGKNRAPRPKGEADRDVSARPHVAESRCRYCSAELRPDFNYCAQCGMPTEITRDAPLFVIEGLTHLFNVAFFESLLEQELNRAIRYAHHISVVVGEIDGLAELEMAYGYATTTTLLRAVGEVVAASIRDSDTLASTNRVAALGTQRFLILLPETAEEGAFTAAEKIRNAINGRAFEVDDGPVAVTVSLGVASATGTQGHEANLLARATQALIEGRGRGANRVQVATSLTSG